MLYILLFTIHMCTHISHIYYAHNPPLLNTPSLPLPVGPKRYPVKRPRRRDLRLSVGDRLHRRLSTHIHGTVQEVDDAYFIASTL